MKLNITRGPVSRPQKVVFYAPEGIGKSTLASLCPRPLFLDLEAGTHQLSVDRWEPQGAESGRFAQVLNVLVDLARDHGEYKTLVVDTVDWLEETAAKGLCARHKKDGIEDFGYGKGWTYLAEEMTVLLSRLDACVASGLHVVLLGHCEVKRQELPDHPPFDRYQLRLTKGVMPLVREWCDALLFGSYKLAVKEAEGERAKGLGGKERQLRCAHSATADAKNRHGLKDIEPWGVETLNKILGAGQTAPAMTTGGREPGKVQQARASETAPVPANNPPSDAAGSPVGGQCGDSGCRIPAAESPAPPPSHAPATPELARICLPYDEAATAFCRRTPGTGVGLEQTWRNMNAEFCARVLRNPAGFIKAVTEGGAK